MSSQQWPGGQAHLHVCHPGSSIVKVRKLASLFRRPLKSDVPQEVAEGVLQGIEGRRRHGLLHRRRAAGGSCGEAGRRSVIKVSVPCTAAC